MTLVSILSAIAVFVLTNVLAGMLPGSVRGDEQLAVWLFALLLAVAAYVIVERAMAGTAPR